MYSKRFNIHVGCYGIESKKKAMASREHRRGFKSVKSGSMFLREAARAYNVPVETLRRCIAGMVSLDGRSGPSTVLMSEEEACLAE